MTVDGYDPLPAETERERRDKDQTGEAFKKLPDWVRTGAMVKGLVLSPGQQKKFQHSLKRPVAGWILVRPRMTGDQYSVGSTGSDPTVYELASDSTSITLAGKGGGGIFTFDLWVW